MGDKVQKSQVSIAFRMARIMKWLFPLTPFFILLLSAIIALTAKSTWPILWGFITAIVGSVIVYVIGIQFCRCPKCGQHWWSPISLGIGWLSLMMYAEMGDDETDTYRCRNCGMAIGPYLRKTQQHH
jgi:predicted RNA-binding Zn-ribbon protein involved in translation (DUF1610 family)